MTDENEEYTGKNEMAVQEIAINKIKLSKNSRMLIGDKDLHELMASIKEHGLLQPIGVIKAGTGYEVCYGNRRFLALGKLGRTKIPAIIHEKKSAQDVDFKNLTENIQRRNISLTEIGRYIELLRKENLSIKEIAVRLAMPVNYIGGCLDAYQRVPKEFREDLEIRNGNRKSTPGKIPINIANKIESAALSNRLSIEQKKSLYTAAKSMTGFLPENVNKYAMALKSGEEEFLKKVTPLRQIVTRYLITAAEYKRLETKYILNGPHKGMGPLFAAILSGKVSEKIKITNNS